VPPEIRTCDRRPAKLTQSCRPFPDKFGLPLRCAVRLTATTRFRYGTAYSPARSVERHARGGVAFAETISTIAQLGNLGIVSVSYWEWIKLIIQSLLLSMAISATGAFAIWWITK
jgi:hypothetical protein